MDAFYASVEIRERPELADKPVVVGGSPQGRGVVSAASYEARKFGIHSAMPTSQAFRLCPHAVFLKPRMELYAEASKRIHEIFNRFTSLVEPLSLDEAFLDVGGSERLFGPAPEIARKIKTLIRSEVGLIASAGVAPNKYLAKVASDLDKPDGLVIVEPSQVLDFLDPLSISRIWGVGAKCVERFQGIGVKTIGHLRGLTVDQMKPMFGVNAQHFWNLARGIDSRRVVPDRIAKSISHESTFAVDISRRWMLEAWAIELMGHVGRRLRRYGIRGRTVQVKIRYSDFQTLSRSKTLSEPTDRTAELIREARQLLQVTLPDNHPPIRLIGMGVSNLTRQEMVQTTLFDEPQHQKDAKLDYVSDEIASRFGAGALRSAKVMEAGIRSRSKKDKESD